MASEEVQVRLEKMEPLVVGSKVYISTNDCDLTEKELEIARVELGETEEKKLKCLQELKDKLSREGNYRTDDDFLLRFLRVRKYDCEKAYENVKNFYKMRNKHSNLIGIPSENRTYTNFNLLTILPYVNEEGCFMFWGDVEYWDPEVMSFEEVIRPAFAISDVAIVNPKLQVNGFIGIYDMKALGLKHVSELLKKNRISPTASMVQFCYPWRIKRVIVLNTSGLARFLYNVFRPLLSRKLTDRVFFLGSDMNDLHQHVDPAILPKKLGGMLDDDFCRRPELILDNIPYLEYDRSFTGGN